MHKNKYTVKYSDVTRCYPISLKIRPTVTISTKTVTKCHWNEKLFPTVTLNNKQLLTVTKRQILKLFLTVTLNNKQLPTVAKRQVLNLLPTFTKNNKMLPIFTKNTKTATNCYFKQKAVITCY